MFLSLIEDVREDLEARADADARLWWEDYVKQGAPFIGVKMSVIRSVVIDWHLKTVDSVLDIDEQVELALELIREDYSEEKLAGILYLQEILIPAGVIGCVRETDRFAELFDDGSIGDWNICDWFCVKVLGPLIRDQGLDCAQSISAWCDAESIWRARASVVPFVKVAGESTYYPLIEESCRALLSRDERFAGTAVGWVLRDISKHDPVFVQRFVEDNIASFPREVLRKATRYLNPDEKERLIQKSVGYKKTI